MSQNRTNISTTRRPRFLISGGGTGGHIFPALSIANSLKRRCPDTEILFVGAEGRMEMEKVPAAGYRITGLPVSGFDRKRLWKNFGVLWKLWKSMRTARKVLRDFAPDYAVGVGGYASGPMLKAAQKAGIPTLLQEQNSYAGVTNKLLAAKACHICVAYPDMERFFPADKIVMTGNPVRDSLFSVGISPAEAKSKLGFDPERPLVLVTGGSLGARSLNVAMAKALDNILASGASVLWQTGKLYFPEYSGMQEGRRNLRIVEFIADMDIAYRAADLMVSRAGASTISEIQLLGKASILVPSPNVAEDHQTKNARALADRGAALMIPDAEVSDRLAESVINLTSDATLRQSIAANALKMALPAADERIADLIFNDLDINLSK